MRIIFLKNGETVGVGEHHEGMECDVADDVAGVLIRRGVAAVADATQDKEVCSINERSSEGERDNGRE